MTESQSTLDGHTISNNIGKVMKKKKRKSGPNTSTLKKISDFSPGVFLKGPETGESFSRFSGYFVGRVPHSLCRGAYVAFPSPKKDISCCAVQRAIQRFNENGNWSRNEKCRRPPYVHYYPWDIPELDLLLQENTKSGMTQISNVLFSDESRFCLRSPDGRKRIRRRHGY